MLLKQKKGQITVFMILGIVLLFSFVFLYYIYLNFSDFGDYSDTTRSLVKASALKAYVTKCLERSAIDGIKLIGQQGGKIFVGSDDEYLEVLNLKVLKGIMKPTSDREPERKPFVQVSPPFSYFGKDKLLSLCDSNGPNKIISGSQSNVQLGYQSCLSYSDTESVQQQLTTYVNFKVLDCARLNEIFEGVTYEIPNTEIVLGDNKIYFNLDFPITYNIGGDTYKIKDFSYELDVRLKALHEFVKNLIKKDITEPDFDISDSESYESLIKFKQGFSVRTQELGNDDIVIIDDFASLIDGHAYSFKFVRENRAPFISFSSAVPWTQSGNDMTINSEISDPDEDNVDLGVSGSGNFICVGDDFVWQGATGSGIMTITASDGVLASEQDVSFEVS